MAVPAARSVNSTGCTSPNSIPRAISIPARSIPESVCKNGCRSNSARLPGRQDHRAAVAEADARMAIIRAEAAEDDLIAVFDEAALLAARERNRLGTARGEFEKAAPTRFLRSGNGA